MYLRFTFSFYEAVCCSFIIKLLLTPLFLITGFLILLLSNLSYCIDIHVVNRQCKVETFWSQYSAALFPITVIRLIGIIWMSVQNSLKRWKLINVSRLCHVWLADELKGLKLLWSMLKSEYNISFLLTGLLNQDALENLFSVLRSRGGHRGWPVSFAE